MPINYPGPFEVRIAYTTVASGVTDAHIVRVSMDLFTVGDPGDPFSAFEALCRNGSVKALDDWVDDFVDVLQPIFRTDSIFGSAELWEYTPGTFDASFLSTYLIAAAGTSASATVDDGQAIITFRTATGGSARLDLRETIYGAGQKLGIGAAPALVIAVSNFFIALVSPVKGRDGGFVFTGLNWLPGTNERAFKERFR